MVSTKLWTYKLSRNLIVDSVNVCWKPIDYSTKWIGIKKAHGTTHNSIQQYMMNEFRGNCTSYKEQCISQQHHYRFTNADGRIYAYDERSCVFALQCIICITNRSDVNRSDKQMVKVNREVTSLGKWQSLSLLRSDDQMVEANDFCQTQQSLLWFHEKKPNVFFPFF